MGDASPVRELCHSLLYSAIQRCRMTEAPCRLSVALRREHLKPLAISVSDTGAESRLSDFQQLDALAAATPTEVWDGTISIATTGIGSTEVHHFQLNLREAVYSETRVLNLPCTFKSYAAFSGSEVKISVSREIDADNFMSWMMHVLRKIIILKAPNLAVELLVTQCDDSRPSQITLLETGDDGYLSFIAPSIDCLTSGLESYALKHGNACDKLCSACLSSRASLKIGKGMINDTESTARRGKVVEAVIIAAIISPETSCWSESCPITKVLYFQNFMPCSMSPASCKAIICMEWQDYGLKIKGSSTDTDGDLIIEWEDTSPLARVDIAVHCYHEPVTRAPRRKSDRILVKRAVKAALDDLKANYAGCFLSLQARKIQNHIPSISRTLADLITTSNDAGFRAQCAALLHLGSGEDTLGENIESCIKENMNCIVEKNDQRGKNGRRPVEKDHGPLLFECEDVDGEHPFPDEDVHLMMTDP